MIILAGILLGAVWGGVYSRRKGGTRLDVAQYAAVWGIIGGLLFTFLAVGLDRFI